MGNVTAGRLSLALAATLMLGLSACSGGGHKSAVTTQPSSSNVSASTTSSGAAVQVSLPGGQSDSALQAKLEQAAVLQNDLPAGWNASMTMGDVPTSGNVSALYTALFSKDGTGAGLATGSSSLVVTLTGYPDAKTAAANLTTPAGSYSVQSAAGKASFKSSSVKLGDGAVTSQVTSANGDIDEIIWRRGQVTAVVMLTLPGGTGSAGMDQATAIAKAQDGKLAAEGL
jgi:hypothetical protein